MAENTNKKKQDISEMTACALKELPPSPEIDKLFEDPQFVCGNCGAQTHSAQNLCNPEPL